VREKSGRELSVQPSSINPKGVHALVWSGLDGEEIKVRVKVNEGSNMIYRRERGT
jgi:hypothetical protein